MKTGHKVGKKVSMKGRNFPPSNHLQFKHRKIPEKPRGRRHDEAPDCGKERMGDAANQDEAEAQT